MKQMAEIVYKNSAQHQSKLNASLEEIKNTLSRPQNWVRISNDLVFNFKETPLDGQLKKGDIYEAKKKIGEKNFAVFEILAFEYIENKSFKLIVKQIKPGSFFIDMINEHYFSVTENSVEYLQILKYNSKLRLEHLIGKYLNRSSHRLSRLIRYPESFEIEDKIIKTAEPVKYTGGMFNSSYRGFKVSYLSSYSAEEIRNFLKDPQNYTLIYPSSRIENNKIIMTFASATGDVDMAFDIQEKEHELILKSTQGSGWIGEITFFHRFWDLENQTNHELEIRYWIAGAILTNYIADRISIVKEGATNVITHILRKIYHEGLGANKIENIEEVKEDIIGESKSDKSKIEVENELERLTV